MAADFLNVFGWVASLVLGIQGLLVGVLAPPLRRPNPEMLYPLHPPLAQPAPPRHRTIGIAGVILFLLISLAMLMYFTEAGRIYLLLVLSAVGGALRALGI